MSANLRDLKFSKHKWQVGSSNDCPSLSDLSWKCEELFYQTSTHKRVKMSAILQSIQEWHQKISVGTSEFTVIFLGFLTWQRLISGPIMDEFLLFSSPIYVIVIVVSYMSFVLYFGPKWMKDREAFKLKYVIIAYNLVQVYYNFWMTQEVTH